MSHVSVVDLEAYNRPKKKKEVANPIWKKNLLWKKNSAQGRKRTHRLWVGLPCSILCFIEIVITYASRAYISFKFSQLCKRKGNKSAQQKNRSRIFQLGVRCRNLCSIEFVAYYAF